jgi:arsenite methyltransferase
MDKENAKKNVKESYGKIAREQQSGCGCGCNNKSEFAESIGYTKDELNVIPNEANLGLGCGNPLIFANLKKGDYVLDLGSGAGMDCFIASNKVGEKGKVIGIDMTPDMIEKAQKNAKKNNVKNVEFRLGEIEHMPVDDNLIDIVISNCVINLSTDKQKVFKEIYRVLKHGGKIAISDIALLKPLPQKIKKSMEAYVGCVSGAMLIDEYKKLVMGSGLKNVKVTIKGSSSCIKPDTNDPIGRAMLDGLSENESLENYVVSVYVEAYKL